MNKKVFAILNPVGGTCSPEVVIKSLDTYIKIKFGGYTLYKTTGKEDMNKVVENALKDGHTLFIAIGGDGTVSSVGEALIHKKIPMGIVPVGTANALAKELGIPINVDQALQLIAGKYATRKIDAMKVKDNYYFLDIGIGAKTLAIKNTKKKDKKKFGIFAYLWSGAKWFRNFRPRSFHITADNVDIRLHAMEVVIANGSTIGNMAFQYGSHIKIDDGIINICVIKATTFADFAPLAYKFVMEARLQKVTQILPLFKNKFQKENHTTNDILAPENKGISNAQIKYINVLKKASIETSSNLPIQADGEIIGEKKITVEVVPQALSIITPQIN